MSVIKFDVAAKEAPHNPRLRKFFEAIGNSLPDRKFPNTAANLQQPFVSPMAWALFSAYQAVIAHAYFQLTVLELGIEDPKELLDSSSVANLLKTALPLHSASVEKFGSAAFHHLLDELEKKLLNELKMMLVGEDVDEVSVAQSAKIMEAVQKVCIETTENYTKAGSREINRPVT